MIAVIFRSRLKPGVEPEIQALGARMDELATRMPALGRERFFSSYRIQVCSIERDDAFP